MTKQERDIFQRLEKKNTRDNIKKILEQIRKIMICSDVSFQEALRRCAHRGVISKRHEQYPLFEELAEVLDSRKTRNIEITDLSRLICYLE